ncbi:hypothetical protein HDU67_002084 [Dinochytrium kinnereticum]|nr:hypothetical protein HDU67_002084 [Dinochytrium kinnereticum]
MLSVVALLALAATVARAAPAPAAAPISLPGFNAPEKVFGQAVDAVPFAGFDTPSAVDIAKAYIADKTNTSFENLLVTSSIEGKNGVFHIHLQETRDGLPVANLVSNVNVDAISGTVLTAGHVAADTSALQPAPLARRAVELDAAQAVISAAKAMGFKTSGFSLTTEGDKVSGAPFAVESIIAAQKYYLTPSNELTKVWELNIHTDSTWGAVYVDSVTGAVVGSADWVSEGGGGSPRPTTTVRPPTPTSTSTRPTSTTTRSTSTTTTRSTSTTTTTTTTTTRPPTTSTTSTAAPGPSPPSIVAVPITEDSILDGVETFAAPKTWFNGPIASGEYQTTGNNVRAARAGALGTSRNGGRFDYVYDTTVGPTTPNNIQAALANVFYATNAYHDLLYLYGFTESASNFQNDNFGRGGRGNDAVNAIVQSADGVNNANFATPPDGQPGTMRMYLFDRTDPQRDGDMDNGVVVHELTHGLSNRLTGGTGNGNCLQTTESRGMGEGWSDTVAWWTTMKPSMTRATDRVIGSYAFNNPLGIRNFPYSTSMTTNKNLYSALKTLTAVHTIGAVWSSILYEVYWNMVEAAGYEDDKYASTSAAGNIRFFENLVDGLKSQPCNPTFISARDAIIASDKINNGGKFVCAIWKGFAKRGLGSGATSAKDDSFTLGDGC